MKLIISQTAFALIAAIAAQTTLAQAPDSFPNKSLPLIIPYAPAAPPTSWG